MLVNLRKDCLDLRASTSNRDGTPYFAGDPNRKENRAKAPLAHPGNVNAAHGTAFTEIELAVEEALRGVVVRVHDKAGEMQLLGAPIHVVCCHTGHEEHSREKAHEGM